MLKYTSVLVMMLLAANFVFGEEDVAEFVRTKIAAGERNIVVPRYRGHVTPKGNTYFEFKGLKDVVIDFNGSDLFGTKRVRFFSLENCTNVTIRNLSLDYDPLAFTQARITAVGPNKEWDMEVIDGYPTAPAECSYWPLQVYDCVNFELINSMRCWDGFKLVRTGERTYRVTGGTNRRGEVGDIAVWPVKDSHDQPSTCAVLLNNCEHCRIENVAIYSTAPGYTYFELFCSGNEYIGCTIDRRPQETDIVKRGLKRLRSANHDAFHSKMAKKGPRLENCRFAYHCDDDVNLNSYYYIVTAVEDGWVRVAGKGDMSFKGVEAPYEMLEAGRMLEVLKHTGKAGADVKMLEVRNGGSATEKDFAFLKTIKMWMGQDRKMRDIRLLRVEGDENLEPGDAITPMDYRADGFVIRNCHFGPNRALGMRIRASNGLIESNVVDRTEGSAVWIGPEVEWPEGGMSHNVTVRGNLFSKCGGGIFIGGRAAYGNPVAPSEHRGMVFTDNRVTGTAPFDKPAFRGVMLPSGRIVEKDFADLQAWGANLARYQMTENFFRHGEMKGGAEAYDRWLAGQLDRLERDILPWARKYGIKLVVDLHIPPGGREANSMDWAVYYDKGLADRLIDWWRKIALRFKGNDDIIYGYDILNEPVQVKKATAYDWWELQMAAAKAIREVDAKTPVIVESLDWDSPEKFAEMKPFVGVGPIIYQAHMYRPQKFTHQGTGSIPIGQAKWPDVSRGWNREFVRERLCAVRDFEKRTGAKIYIGEFSAAIWAEGADRYMEDCIAVFGEYGWDWTYHAFRESSMWSVEHEGTEWKNVRPSTDNPRMRVLKSGLKAR